MRGDLRPGDQVRLSAIGRRSTAEPQRDRTGVVVSISKSGTQCRVRWDNVIAPQLFHKSFLDHVPERAGGTDVETGLAADLIPHMD